MINKLHLILCFIICFSTFAVKAQEITMFSGFWDYQYYQDDTRINKKELVEILEKDEFAKIQWEKSKIFSTLSIVALSTEAGFATWEIADGGNPDNNIVTGVGVLGSLVAVVTFGLISENHKKKAILKYNQGLDNAATFKVMPAKRGIGVVLQF